VALENSDRTILKATHTPLQFERRSDDEPEPTRTVDKAAFVRRLQLQSGEVEAVRQHSRDMRERDSPSEATWSALSQFEPRGLAALAPSASAVSPIPVDELVKAGQAVLSHRIEMLDTTTQEQGAPARGEVVRSLNVRTRAPEALLAQSLVTFARGALETFGSAFQVTPIGMLHLERIEMAPAGIERGELLATIPLAPQETTSVVQKEWAVTSSEFSEIVTDYLETYSEKGVTEKSELAQASESQTKRDQQLGLDASVSGSYGFVTFATSAKFSTSVSEADSAKASRTHAAQVTAKASARVRKERKVTIQTKDVAGSEETTSRTLTNPSDTETMRIDYYSMMRKWRVRLLQYGLRLTYDIAIPEPGATLRQAHAELVELEAAAAAPFAFELKPEQITRDNFKDHANAYGVAVPEPPLAFINERIGGAVPGLNHEEAWHFNELEVHVPDGYAITNVFLDAMLGNVNNDDPDARAFTIFGYGSPPGLGQNGKASFVEDLSNIDAFLKFRTGVQKIVYFIQNVDSAAVTFALTYQPTNETMDQWQFAVWQALYTSARDSHAASVQAMADRRAELQARIANVDTLTLRREERDEVMKGVLHWLLGPDFDFMPDSVAQLFSQDLTLRRYGESFTGNELGLSSVGWSTMFVYEEMVKFIQEAIEWENLLYFPYSYFWDVPAAWDFVRTLEHPDSTRQEFIRAGSARVVLTIRPGYEDAFASFVEQGELGSVLPPGHPYLTIGDEIRAYDQTNFPGIPPANPAKDYRPLLTPRQRKAWEQMQAIMALLEQYRTANGNYPTTAEGLDALTTLGSVPAADPWGKPYVYASPGVYNDYDLSSLGSDEASGGVDEATDITSYASASLIAEWYEYTPSHGIDIAIDTAPANMN
jgi:hypothetical protein